MAGSEVTMFTNYRKKLFEEIKWWGTNGPGRKVTKWQGFEATTDKNGKKLYEELKCRGRTVPIGGCRSGRVRSDSGHKI